MSAVIFISFVALVAQPKIISHSTREQQSNEQIINEKVIDDRAQRIDEYYSKRNMQLAGYGEKLVAEADEHGIDWRLVAAISVKESSGGIHMCENNPFGWGSCKIEFENLNKSIETVSKALGEGKPYIGKTTQEKLKVYNPPSIEPLYSNRVMAIMEKI